MVSVYIFPLGAFCSTVFQKTFEQEFANLDIQLKALP